MLTTCLLSLGVFALSLPQPRAMAEDGGAPPDVIHFGTWNIEHYGNPESRPVPFTRILQKPEDLARYIRYAKVDLLALQEIAADGGPPPGFAFPFRSSKGLKKTFEILNKGTNDDWQHVLFPKAFVDDRQQWVGVAWKASRLKQVGPVFRVPVSQKKSSQGKKLLDRNVHAIMFSAGKGKTDFLVIPIHLKSDFNGTYSKQRAEECKEIVAKLSTLAGKFPGEKDIIILGDTNIQKATEPAIAVMQQAKFRDLNKFDRDTHTGKGIQPFDRIFVPGDQPEFKMSAFLVLDSFQKQQKLSFKDYRSRYSDHYIAVSQIRVMKDDD